MEGQGGAVAVLPVAAAWASGTEVRADSPHSFLHGTKPCALGCQVSICSGRCWFLMESLPGVSRCMSVGLRRGDLGMADFRVLF